MFGLISPNMDAPLPPDLRALGDQRDCKYLIQNEKRRPVAPFLKVRLPIGSLMSGDTRTAGRHICLAGSLRGTLLLFIPFDRLELLGKCMFQDLVHR